MADEWYDDPTSRGFSWTGPGSDGHNGYDIATPYHSDVTALYSGTVSYVGVQPGVNGSPGAEVEIQTDDPYYGKVTDLYLHLDQIAANLQAGEHINAGDLLGKSGGETQQQVAANPSEYPDAEHPVINTSYTYSTGPHTHFGIFAGQTSIGQDAWDYINDFRDPAREIADARGGKLGTGAASSVGTAATNATQALGLPSLPNGLQAVLNAIGIPQLPPWQDIAGVVIGVVMIGVAAILVVREVTAPATNEAIKVAKVAAETGS